MLVWYSFLHIIFRDWRMRKQCLLTNPKKSSEGRSKIDRNVMTKFHIRSLKEIFHVKSDTSVVYHHIETKQSCVDWHFQWEPINCTKTSNNSAHLEYCQKKGPTRFVIRHLSSIDIDVQLAEIVNFLSINSGNYVYSVTLLMK